MSWPYFAELGKDAMGIFHRGYNTGLFVLGVSSKTPTDVEISSKIETNLDTYNASGDLQTKYKTKCGSFLLKLDTENKFSTEVTFRDMFGQGTQISLDFGYAPQEGYKSFRARSFYANDICSLSADLDSKVGKSTLVTSVVAGHCYWVGGMQAMFDLNKKKMITNSVALGYLTEDFSFHSAYNNGHELNGSVYQKVNSKLDIGVQMATSSTTKDAQLGLGCRYQLDPEATVFGKVDSSGEVGVGYRQKLHEGVILHVSSVCNINDPSGRGCKLGVALNFHL